MSELKQGQTIISQGKRRRQIAQVCEGTRIKKNGKKEIYKNSETFHQKLVRGEWVNTHSKVRW